MYCHRLFLLVYHFLLIEHLCVLVFAQRNDSDQFHQKQVYNLYFVFSSHHRRLMT
uniref:Uncharacterized protein n=1 Tax=Siphoviridae sp. ctxMM9 TaxID=2827973 RepID=A0A8S5T6H1_9CAUD|nr:MAG TPA: hypothetical protein [Siphoviridae sp. ctxMM9]